MQILGTGYQRAAKLARVLVGPNAQPLTFASWEATLNGDDLVTVNFESYLGPGMTAYPPFSTQGPQTYDEGILGVIGADIRFGGDWDAHLQPFVNTNISGPLVPPGLYPRDDLTSLLFVTARQQGNTSPEAQWNFPYARLRSCVNSAEVKGKVAFNCSGKNQGPFFWPSGAV